MKVILPEETYLALLANWPVARLATVSADAQPHSVPIVFCTHNGVIYSPLDGKRKKSRRLKRFTNIATNPKVTLLLDDYTADWQNLWWVRIDGKADRFEPSVEEASAIAERLLAKYPQYRNPSLMFDVSVYLRLRPGKISAWTQADSVAIIDAAISAASAHTPTA